MGTIRGILIRKSDDWYRFNRIVYPLTETLISFYNEHGGLAAAKAARHVEDEATMARACACL